MYKVVIIILFFFNVLQAKAQTGTGETRRDSICVTMKELLTNPKKYHQKFIAVSGYIFLEKKVISAIYISENDYQNEIFDNSIWLSFHFESSTYPTSKKYNKTFSTIVGWYYSGNISENNEYLGKEVETNNGFISDLRFYDK